MNTEEQESLHGQLMWTSDNGTENKFKFFPKTHMNDVYVDDDNYKTLNTKLDEVNSDISDIRVDVSEMSSNIEQTMNEMVMDIDSNLNTLTDRVNSDIDLMRTGLINDIDSMQTRIDERLESFNDTISQIDESISEINNNIETLGGNIDDTNSNINDLPSFPLSTRNGGTGNSVGYIRTGQRSGTNIGNSATIEGYNNTASGDYSHAEGYSTNASGDYSHAEGAGTTATGNFSHTEGSATSSDGENSHAEGCSTIASGVDGHAEGYSTNASGDCSHAEGVETEASGEASHASGLFTIANNDAEFVCGKYNKKLTTSIFEVGNGIGSETKNRSNAFDITSSGIARASNFSRICRLNNNLYSDPISNYEFLYPSVEVDRIEEGISKCTNFFGNAFKIVGDRFFKGNIYLLRTNYSSASFENHPVGDFFTISSNKLCFSEDIWENLPNLRYTLYKLTNVFVNRTNSYTPYNTLYNYLQISGNHNTLSSAYPGYNSTDTTSVICYKFLYKFEFTAIRDNYLQRINVEISNSSPYSLYGIPSNYIKTEYMVTVNGTSRIRTIPIEYLEYVDVNSHVYNLYTGSGTVSDVTSTSDLKDGANDKSGYYYIVAG